MVMRASRLLMVSPACSTKASGSTGWYFEMMYKIMSVAHHTLTQHHWSQSSWFWVGVVKYIVFPTPAPLPMYQCQTRCCQTHRCSCDYRHTRWSYRARKPNSGPMMWTMPEWMARSYNFNTKLRAVLAQRFQLMAAQCFFNGKVLIFGGHVVIGRGRCAFSLNAVDAPFSQTIKRLVDWNACRWTYIGIALATVHFTCASQSLSKSVISTRGPTVCFVLGL